MVIIHYFLGFPPYRSGGLTKYSVDLMNAQAQNGDTIIALWPGRINLLLKQSRIIKKKNVNNIVNYELVNPLPVSLDEGIKNIDEYTKPIDINVFLDFFEKECPEIIHIHTLMGLPKEFVMAAKKLNIKTVFTSHDYFGICPKVTLYKNGCVCNDDDECRNCVYCNETALTLKKIQVMQSALYRNLKNTYIVSKIRQMHRKKFFIEEKNEKIINEKNDLERRAEDYRKLRKFYINILRDMDIIHFNSSMTKEIYGRYFDLPKNKVLTISHKNIKDNRNVNRWEYHQKLRLTCLAPAKPFKGYKVLIESLDELWKQGKREFQLKMFNMVPDKRPYMQVQEKGFVYADLKQIMNETDVLIAPSVSYETFGFTVLEALSFGVPVIVSDHVGAKDIVNDAGIIVKAGDNVELCNAISTLTKDRLYQLRKNVKQNVTIISWKQFIEECYKLYRL